MKYFGTPWAITTIAFALLITSIAFNFKFASLANGQRMTISHLTNKIDAQKKALELSDSIMDNNEIWDRDGSDLMVDYLNLRSKLDRDFMSGFYENALIDSLSYSYNE